MDAPPSWGADNNSAVGATWSWRPWQPRPDERGNGGLPFGAYAPGGIAGCASNVGGRDSERHPSAGVRPALPRKQEESVLEYVRALTSRYGLPLSTAAEQAWKRFERRASSPLWPSIEGRVLTLEPHAQDRIPAHYWKTHIDVALRGVDGKCSSLYDLGEVTGVDERVQAVVASQPATALCLYAALERIEEEDLDEFSFVCHGATHRSVACCLLLTALAYPQAHVRLTTPRTRRAAKLAGLL